MPDFLTFTLAAPLAAMGDIAVGERRGTWDRPGRSAVLGLVAACLGVDRSDEGTHLALESEFGLALRIERLGPLVADYHTAQVPPARRGRRFATRAEELASGDLGTILSRRDYYADVFVFVALWPRGFGDAEGARGLEKIAIALRTPFYTPYLGRKACPLMLPLNPQIVQAIDPVVALAARAAWHEARDLPFGIRSTIPPLVALDADQAEYFGLQGVHRVELRRDRLVSRRRWQFTLREEAVLEQS